MEKINDIVLNNMREARDIIAMRGGKIDFVHSILRESGKDVHEYWYCSDTDVLGTPKVVLDGDRLTECAVLSVKLVGKNQIKFLVYDVNLAECIGWCGRKDLAFNSDNSVYEYLERFS